METCSTVEALQVALYSLLQQTASTRQDEQQHSLNLAATFLFNFHTEMSVVQGETFSLRFFTQDEFCSILHLNATEYKNGGFDFVKHCRPFFFRRWPTVVLQLSLRSERVIFHEQEGGRVWCHAITTLHFNWTLRRKSSRSARI
jgi:hypothetical protein